MIVLGIDPGLSGGLAIIKGLASQAPKIIAVSDIPAIGESAKRRVDVIAVLAFIEQNMPDFAFIERAQAMPDQGASSGFIYGRAVGHLEACIMGLRIPWETVEPTAWKKAHGLIKTDKEASRQKALMLFPGAHELMARKMDHGRAEAALIANFGRMLKNAGMPGGTHGV